MFKVRIQFSGYRDQYFWLICIKPYNVELHNFYFSPSIIRMIKPRRMRRAWHVARMREKRNAYRVLVGNPEGKNH
jgi:hypothetical protein